MTMLDRMRRHRNWLKWSVFAINVGIVVYMGLLRVRHARDPIET